MNVFIFFIKIKFIFLISNLIFFNPLIILFLLFLLIIFCLPNILACTIEPAMSSSNNLLSISIDVPNFSKIFDVGLLNLVPQTALFFFLIY